jgi:hypothetical protein
MPSEQCPGYRYITTHTDRMNYENIICDKQTFAHTFTTAHYDHNDAVVIDWRAWVMLAKFHDPNIHNTLVFGLHLDF